MSKDDELRYSVEINGETYTPEDIAENREELILSTSLKDYNLGDVKIELLGASNIEEREMKRSVKLLEKIYTKREGFKDREPKLNIKEEGQGPGKPLIGDKLKEIDEMLELA